METYCSLIKSALGIDNFQLETAACAFKKIWRVHESRYVGYYQDRMLEDIRSVEKLWRNFDFTILYKARENITPKDYRNSDLGIDKAKFHLSPDEKANL